MAGTPLREGLDRILQSKMGALIVVGDGPEVLNICSGGFLLDAAFSPQRLSELAKMDGAIILNANATKITMANVQLMPDPTILSLETGTRHRTAERVSKQTDALVVAVSQRRDVVIERAPVNAEIAAAIDADEGPCQVLVRPSTTIGLAGPVAVPVGSWSSDTQVAV